MLLPLALLAAPAWAAVAAPAQVVLAGDSAAAAAVPFRCDLPPVVAPPDDGLPAAAALFGTQEALQKQVERHRAVVRVPTVSYDDMGEVDADPRWRVFYELHAVLAELYPAVHTRMTLDKVNHLGLVYSLNGSDPALRPLMLTAHQDVVPVAAGEPWTHPPFAGHYDGRWLWGRGASDDKNSLTAELSALEALLAATDAAGRPAWTPRRGVVLAFGFDEEVSGYRGAARIAAFLEARYGRNGIAMLLDEGGAGLELVGGADGVAAGEEDAEDAEDASSPALYAHVAVMEKGFLNVRMDLRVAGGHASVPPPHTGLGMAAALVVALEAHPYAPAMPAGSAAHRPYVCRARYSPHADRALTRLVRAGDLPALVDYLLAPDSDDDTALTPAAAEARARRYLLQTSQAVDVLHGGVKINALPASVALGVNMRVAPQDGLAAVRRRVVDVLRPVAAAHGLAMEAFGAAVDTGVLNSAAAAGSLNLTADGATDVFPESPAAGPVWDLFAGTIRHSFAFAAGGRNGTVVPLGTTMNGNTDTRHYHGLTRHVYRWIPERQGASQSIHTVDERVDMAVHMEMVQFFYNLVRNFGSSDV